MHFLNKSDNAFIGVSREIIRGLKHYAIMERSIVAL